MCREKPQGRPVRCIARRGESREAAHTKKKRHPIGCLFFLSLAFKTDIWFSGFRGKECVRENRQGCLECFIPAARISLLQMQKDILADVLLLLELEMGLEPTTC